MMTQPTEFNFDIDLKPYMLTGSHLEGFFIVKNPLYVFKSAYSVSGYKVIISMVIPVGAMIFIGETSYGNPRRRINLKQCGKMRASAAYVHSIVAMCWNGRKYEPIKYLKHARSGHYAPFKYETGKTVIPDHFGRGPRECSGGIHFFLNAKQALEY